VIEHLADGVTLFRGDCREILPRLELEAVITDPVWPNAPANSVQGSDRPEELFGEVAPLFRSAARVVVQMGCDSDPRMLAALDLPFLRACWLEYACPTYKGRLLHTGDVAYCYGEWPAPRPGAMVIPGRCISATGDEFVRGTRRPGQGKGRPWHAAAPDAAAARFRQMASPGGGARPAKLCAILSWAPALQAWPPSN
jgi:hypothetical protein